MGYSLIYVQSNDVLGRTIKEYLDAEDLEVIIASNAQETFNILRDRKISIMLVDSYIPDMRHRDFIDRICSEYPEIVLNVCMDLSDNNYLNVVSMKENVWKMHVPPFSIEKIVEGVEATRDRLYIADDYISRRKSFENEEKELEKTLERLKASLVRQKYSYNVIAPFFNALLDGFAAKSQMDDKIKNVMCAAAKKMLTLQTTSVIKSDNLTEVIANNINEIGKEKKAVVLDTIDNCIIKDIPKKILVDIVFAIWLSVYYESLSNENLSVEISSRYISSVRCEFVVKISGNIMDEEEPVREKLMSLLMAITNRVKAGAEEKAKIYTFVFDLGNY